MNDHNAFLDQLQNLVHVLTAETRQVHYIEQAVHHHDRRKAGSRRKQYLFQCLNCGETATKKSRARYCSARCRKAAERRREAATQFWRERRADILDFLENQGEQLQPKCDNPPTRLLKSIHE